MPPACHWHNDFVRNNDFSRHPACPPPLAAAIRPPTRQKSLA
ncbi:hypothetical protein [Trichothermofontia sp.]